MDLSSLFLDLCLAGFGVLWTVGKLARVTKLVRGRKKTSTVRLGARLVFGWLWRRHPRRPVRRRAVGMDRDRRVFSTAERAVILDRAAGACERCHRVMHYESDCPVGSCGVDYNADHVTPWSRGGATDLTNSQALCRTCNLYKSDR